MKTLKCDKCDWSRESTGNPSSDKKSFAMHMRMAHGKKRKYIKHVKRKYTKRTVANAALIVKYCPGCGCNIEAVGVALNLVRQ